MNSECGMRNAEFENCQPKDNRSFESCQSKPVRCGCGGKGDIHFIGNTSIGEYQKFIGKYFICCEECGIKTSICKSKKEAIEAWNKAMGAGKDDVAITKGNWMMTYDGLHCSVCNYKCETTALPEVCPHCGTSMMTAG